MNAVNKKRFNLLIAKIASLDSLNELTRAERHEYNRLADAWNNEQPVAAENYGF